MSVHRHADDRQEHLRQGQRRRPRARRALLAQRAVGALTARSRGRRGPAG
jgi:hypothetical protein